MYFNFFLREMTHVRYYVPIIKEAKKRGIKSRFCIVPSNKYNCPSKHIDIVKKLVKEHGIDVFEGELTSLEGFFFINESSGLNVAKEVAKLGKCKIVVTTYQTDFINCYEKYYDIADHIVMPSMAIAEYYGLHNDKNLYVGIPKYDLNLDKKKIINKYGLDHGKKKVLMMWPKTRDLGKFPIDIVDNFTELGWQVLVKARRKDPISEKTKKFLLENGHQYFYDGWYPHTSQELLEVSDLAVNCGSTTIEECVMHEVPVINFDIKPETRHGKVQKYRVTHSYLYDYEFCMNLRSLNVSFSTRMLREMIEHLNRKTTSAEFKKCKKEWLYDHKNACKNLLDVILS
jgi:hypothetical protein